MISTTEIWRAVPEFEGLYSVSSKGRVRSEDRIVKRGKHTQKIQGRIMKPTPNHGGYLMVQLYRDGVAQGAYIHDLVTAAFLGKKPRGLEVRHLSDVKTDCSITNLAYGSRSANQLDSVRNGTHFFASRTHCGAGHPYTPETTVWRVDRPGHRRCRTCDREYQRRHDLKRSEVAAA